MKYYPEKTKTLMKYYWAGGNPFPKWKELALALLKILFNTIMTCIGRTIFRLGYWYFFCTYLANYLIQISFFIKCLKILTLPSLIAGGLINRSEVHLALVIFGVVINWSGWIFVEQVFIWGVSNRWGIHSYVNDWKD